MPTLQKEETIRSIVEDLKACSAVWIVDYRGLTVKQSEELRRSIKEADGTIKVLKNTLTKRALAELGLPSMDEYLHGPSAFVFAGEDPVLSAKAVKAFGAKNKNLVIKGGLMEGEVLTPEQVKAVADLPSREQLIGMVAGAIAGVARGLAVSISGVSRGLAVVAQAIADQKSAA